jgi:2-polyprenyl-3-methyl-5-hydroxy-6-metoxy-1,4-benzoquinol methylase
MENYLPENDDERLREARQYWDNLASAFDDMPDHGLRDSHILTAWTDLLRTSLSQPNASILDVGCGTGSLSVVLAGLGHTVTGIDVSPSMIALAQTKAAQHGYQIEFHVMDAAYPQLSPRKYDVLVCRHLLWVLPDPEKVLQRWLDLLKQKGRLILIEGYWGTGAGLHAQEIIKMLPSSLTAVSVLNLSEFPNLWGANVTDERYAIIADTYS